MFNRSLVVTFLFIICFSSYAFSMNTVTIVCEDDFAPYGYKSKTGKASGFSTDVIIAAYKTVGIDAKFKVMPYARGMSLITKGEEIGCYNTNNDEINLKKHYFTEEPLFIGEMVIWALSDYEGNISVEELSETGETVGVTIGYNYDAPGVNFDYNKNIKKDPANKVILTLRKLLTGRYKFAAAEKNVAKLVIARNKAELNNKIKVVGFISNPGLFLSFSKKHPEGKKYCDLLNKGLINIKNNGLYLQLQNKWDELIQNNNLP